MYRPQFAVKTDLAALAHDLSTGSTAEERNGPRLQQAAQPSWEAMTGDGWNGISSGHARAMVSGW
jgi:hypothetical protein